MILFLVRKKAPHTQSAWTSLCWSKKKPKSTLALCFLVMSFCSRKSSISSARIKGRRLATGCNLPSGYTRAVESAPIFLPCSNLCNAFKVLFSSSLVSLLSNKIYSPFEAAMPKLLPLAKPTFWGDLMRVICGNFSKNKSASHSAEALSTNITSKLKPWLCANILAMHSQVSRKVL